MEKAVLIAEKPSLMREIKSVYMKNKNKIDYEIEFVAFAGHSYRLALPSEYEEYEGYWDIDRLPIMPSWNRYKIVVNKGQEKTIAEINKKIRETKPDIIINACDPDREGEHIFRLFRDVNLSRFKGEIKRFWCNDLSEKEILKNLINLQEQKFKLQDAAFCRAKTDWLIGMNLTEAATVTFNKGKSTTIKIGRVKTTLLNICYKREMDIKNFKPSSKFQIKVDYDNGINGTLIENNENVEFQTIEEAKNFIKNIDKGPYKVKSLIQKTKTTKAPQLYKLSDIQIEAGKKYGYTASHVLEIVQSLYEKKFVSYPRTDLRYISKEAAKDIPSIFDNIKKAFPEFEKYINNIMKDDVVKIAQSNTNLCNDSKVNESGHTALITTTHPININFLSEEEINILKMICIRLISMFLEPLKEKCVEMITVKNNTEFKSTYKILINKGYTELLDKKGVYVENINIKEGSMLDVDKIYEHEVKSVCPSRFTSAELVQIMENPAKYLFNANEDNKNTIKKIHGIGTPATRGAIIDSLFQDKYCEMAGKNKTIKVTDLGISIMNILTDVSFAKVDLTARWEKQLSQVEKGEMGVDEYKRSIEEYIRECINIIKDMKGKSVNNTTKLNVKCPKCSSDILVGKNYYYCSKYGKGNTDCKFVLPLKILNASITNKDVENLLNGKIIEKTVSKGDTSWKQPIAYTNDALSFVKKEQEVIGKCPCCGNNIVKKNWGYGCNGYTNGCEFSISDTVAQKKITKKIVKDLIENGETKVIDGFVNKQGEEFSAKLCIVDGKVKFKFK